MSSISISLSLVFPLLGLNCLPPAPTTDTCCLQLQPHAFVILIRDRPRWLTKNRARFMVAEAPIGLRCFSSLRSRLIRKGLGGATLACDQPNFPSNDSMFLQLCFLIAGYKVGLSVELRTKPV
ncbi:hypothetical protein NL676_021179 [Syzygium grande]|nr:hypothetical protein NL676_021179 [Syzygium grande]